MPSPVPSFTGWSPTDFVPGYYAQTLFAQGAVTAGSLTKKCLVTGTKTAAGTATPSQDINQIFTPAQSDALHGPGSEINLMCVAALTVPNVALYAAPVAEAFAPTAGTLTLTFTGTPGPATGNVVFYLDGVRYSFAVTASETLTNVGAGMLLALQANARVPVTATNTTGAVLMTTVSKGIRSGDHSFYLDMSQAPAWLIGTISGSGSTLTGGNGIVGAKFTAGTGTEVLSTLLTLLWPGTWDYIGAAQNDATNAALWKAQVEGKAGITEGRLEQFTIGQNTTLSAATSIAQTTLNEYRASCAWINDGETPASQIAAGIAALRSVTEGSNPVAFYDGLPVPGCAPNRFVNDIPLHSQQVSAILNSVTPIVTVNGVATFGLLITTYSLFGASPDYRCLQTYYVSMTDYARLDVGLQWTSSVKPNNPRVADDVANGQPQPPAGVSTPSRITSWATRIARGYEALGWFTNVSGNLPVAGYNPTAKRIEMVFPNPVTAGNHQLGAVMAQLNSPYPPYPVASL